MILYVALGGALGSVGRYLLTGLVGRHFGTAFPYGTMAVNVTGGFAMGLLVGLLARFGNVHEAQLRLFFGVGVLGGFTTFSAFSLDNMLLIERGQYAAASLYIAASVAGSIAALMLGLWLARGIG